MHTHDRAPAIRFVLFALEQAGAAELPDERARAREQQAEALGEFADADGFCRRDGQQRACMALAERRAFHRVPHRHRSRDGAPEVVESHRDQRGELSELVLDARPALGFQIALDSHRSPATLLRSANHSKK